MSPLMPSSQRGASAIEFAVTLPLLLLLLWGVVTFANVLHARMIIARAAEDGARSVSFFSAARNYGELPATALADCSTPGAGSVKCEVLESLTRSLQIYELGGSSSHAAAI